MKDTPHVRRALLVDDDPLLGKLVSYGLSGSGIECIHLTSYEQAMDYLDASLASRNAGSGGVSSKAGSADLDVVILDYYLNDGKTALPLCKKIRIKSNLPVVMLTGEKSVQTTIKCLEEGADQYICKPFDVDELVARIKASIRARKARQLAAPAGSSGDFMVNVGERILKFAGATVPLTEKESLLADVLSRNMGFPVSKEEIFENVYGRYAGMHTRCLDMLVGRLRKKLALTGNRCRILSARNLGYKLIVKNDD